MFTISSAFSLVVYKWKNFFYCKAYYYIILIGGLFISAVKVFCLTSNIYIVVLSND